MLSTSSPTFLIFSIAFSTVIFSFKSTNSVVIILPALSSGYLNNSLIIFLSSEFCALKIRLTTLAGISSIKSTVSSIKISSSTFFNSLSEKALIKFSCISGSSSTKTSAAISFDNKRQTTTVCSSSSSSKILGISALFKLSNILRISAYFFCSNNSCNFSTISLSPFLHYLYSYTQ